MCPKSYEPLHISEHIATLRQSTSDDERVVFISLDRFWSQFSTETSICTVFPRRTFSPSCDRICSTAAFFAVNPTEWIPAKSFLRCVYNRDINTELIMCRVRNHLNDARVGGLAENLKQIVVTDEIKARKDRALLFQELIQALLAARKLVSHLVELRAQTRACDKRQYYWRLPSVSTYLIISKPRSSRAISDRMLRKSSSTILNRPCSLGKAPRPNIGSLNG